MIVHCLAVEVRLLPSGEIDASELEGFLDNYFGPRRWLMTSVWLFAQPPVGWDASRSTVPVICSGETFAGVRAKPAAAARLLRDHRVGEVELRGWRWIARQVFPDREGRLPWEVH